jgi:Ethanolamine utilization protein EutJ (predicted chaperonin)
MCGGGSALVGIINQGTVIHTPQELQGVQHITYAVGGVEHSVLLAGTRSPPHSNKHTFSHALSHYMHVCIADDALN